MDGVHPIIQAFTLRECRCGALAVSVHGKSIRDIIYRCGSVVAWDVGAPPRVKRGHGATKGGR